MNDLGVRFEHHKRAFQITNPETGESRRFPSGWYYIYDSDPLEPCGAFASQAEAVDDYMRNESETALVEAMEDQAEFIAKDFRLESVIIAIHPKYLAGTDSTIEYREFVESLPYQESAQ